MYDEGDDPFAIDFSDGFNVIVGRNNCGSSNILRAIALAIDPQFPFDKTCDLPAQKVWARPTVTLRFVVPGRTGPEKTLLKYASEYERSVKEGARARTYADDHELHLQVQYAKSGDEYRRSERIKIKGAGALQGPADEREKVLRQLRSVVRFVLFESGQSLEAMLEGRFREILHSVIRDHLRAQLDQARRDRAEYVRKLQVAVLRYLAAQSKRSMIFAVEEPEAFLRPCAQRMLGKDLLELSRQRDVTLIATTHSPFIIPREAGVNVISLNKDRVGRTKVLGHGEGAARSADLLTPLFGELASAEIFERTTEFDPEARGILLVEGETDRTYLRAAAAASGKGEFLDGLVIEPANGTTNLLAREAQLLWTAPCPVIVLLDSDENGRHARKISRKHLKMRKRQVLSYGDFLGKQFDWE